MEKDYRFFAKQKGFNRKFNQRQLNGNGKPFNKFSYQNNKPSMGKNILLEVLKTTDTSKKGEVSKS